MGCLSTHSGAAKLGPDLWHALPSHAGWDPMPCTTNSRSSSAVPRGSHGNVQGIPVGAQDLPSVLQSILVEGDAW